MAPLSVIIITYNEEINIRRCLESVQGVGDEIIVVDSGSVDNTADICRSMGAKVIQQDFLGYIEQKNFATSQAKNEWILSLDADEAVFLLTAKDLYRYRLLLPNLPLEALVVYWRLHF